MKWTAALFVIAMVFIPRVVAHAQFTGPKVADAKPGDLRVIATAAIRDPFDAVRKQAESLIGKPIIAEYGSARGNLKEMILKGQDFELAMLLPDVDDDILAAGKIMPDRFEIARVPIALGLRGEAPAPDVSTLAAVKAAMLNARSVRYAPTGAALMTVKKILSMLEIADKVRDSSTARAEVPLGAGEYEINIYPLSEIIPNKRLRILGAVIAPLQAPAIVEATVGRNATDPKATRALITFLQGPAIDQPLKDFGMEKGRVGR